MIIIGVYISTHGTTLQSVIKQINVKRYKTLEGAISNATIGKE